MTDLARRTVTCANDRLKSHQNVRQLQIVGNASLTHGRRDCMAEHISTRNEGFGSLSSGFIHEQPHPPEMPYR
ncbi:hypothetical protein [Streptomyces sp. NBC_01508]|uniref:hypothetical protein n=1 Tax=Streptomyces sp. NBC_01508 TaxID=2903888 RepID=UPI0038657F6A